MCSEAADHLSSKNMESQSLFGVHEILGSATGYLKRSFHVPNPRPLLLIGGNGNGKTTLAKAIGRLLENDKKYLTGASFILSALAGLISLRGHISRCY